MDRNNTFSLNRSVCVRVMDIFGLNDQITFSIRLSNKVHESEMASEKKNIEIKGNYSCRFVWNLDDLMWPTA